MAMCQFCERQFKNTQAVRAHLKACPVYQERDQAAGSALGSVALGTVPEAPGVGTEPTDEEGDREGQREAARQRAQERASRQAAREVQDYLRRATAERRARERRALIQSVKEEVVGYGSQQHPTIPADVKAEALQAIERKLSALPLDQLPRREVLQIAEGVRDRLFRPVLEAQEAARQRARTEEEARHRASRAEEEAARRRKEEAARERAEAKRRLVEHGMAVADRELRADSDLDPEERREIRARVRSVLEAKLSGEESKEEVDELVDDILEEESAEDDENDDDEEVDEFGEDEDNDNEDDEDENDDDE